MVSLALILSLSVPVWQQAKHGQAGPASPVATGAAADAITLKDGKVVLGQVVESPDRRAPLVILVRRGWAEANLPEQAAAWEKAEAPTIRRADSVRRERLVAWRRSRPAQADPQDRLTPWLDAEVARLGAASGKGEAPTGRTPLMLVRLPRTGVKAVVQKPKATGRLLRLAWAMDFLDPESTPLDDLNRGLEDRGFSAASDAPVAIEALLPTPLESDAEWQVRRAATELAHLPGGRFLLHGGAALPEPAVGEAMPLGGAMEALDSTVRELLGEERKDPLPAKFRELAGQGRVGAVVTSLEMAPDMSAATVTTTLWVAPGGGRDWVPAIHRASTVRPGDLPADAGANLAEDPQVKAALNIVGQLGLGEIPPELKQRSLNMGYATQKALNDARTALNEAIGNLALPLEAPKAAESAPSKP